MILYLFTAVLFRSLIRIFSKYYLQLSVCDVICSNLPALTKLMVLFAIFVKQVE